MLIMNEKRYVEELLDSESVNINKPSETVSLLIKYYKSKGVDRLNCYTLVNNYMLKNYKAYNEVNWYDLIQKYTKQIYKNDIKLKEINSIPIYDYELDKIQSIKSKVLQKILFTMLVVSKFNNMNNPKNNNWINLEDKEIFKLANVKRTINEQCNLLHKLYSEFHLIEFSKKVDNTNNRLMLFTENELNDNSNNDKIIKLNVYKLEDLGLLYEQYIGNSNIIKCESCGRLFIKNKKCKKNQKYCTKCSAKMNKIYQKKWNENHKK